MRILFLGRRARWPPAPGRHRGPDRRPLEARVRSPERGCSLKSAAPSRARHGSLPAELLGKAARSWHTDAAFVKRSRCPTTHPLLSRGRYGTFGIRRVEQPSSEVGLLVQHAQMTPIGRERDGAKAWPHRRMKASWHLAPGQPRSQGA